MKAYRILHGEKIDGLQLTYIAERPLDPYDGGVSGFGGELNPFSLVTGATRMVGIYVGSRAMLEQTAGFFAAAGIKPVVDRVFPFVEAKEAYRHLKSGAHFGKVVIDVTE